MLSWLLTKQQAQSRPPGFTCTFGKDEAQPGLVYRSAQLHEGGSPGSKTEQTLSCDIGVVLKEVWGGEGSTPDPTDREAPPESSPFLRSHPAGEDLRR